MTKREFIKTETIRILKFKIDFEKTMIREIKTYFNQQRINKRTGNNLDSIEPVLERQYKRIAKGLLNSNKKQETEIERTLRAFIEGKAKQRARVIDETSNDDYADAIRQARNDLADQGNTSPTENELVIAASAVFARKGRGRAGNIATTETQFVTEGLRREITVATHKELESVIVEGDQERADELYEISRDYTTYSVAKKLRTEGIAVLTALIISAIKTWINVGDNKVRTPPRSKFDHVEANRQEVAINEAFIVSGELLMNPGDTSLGASVGNVVGCRCTAIYL